MHDSKAAIGLETMAMTKAWTMMAAAAAVTACALTPLAAAARFWTNFGKRHGGGIFAAPTHPRWKERVKLVTAEAETMRQLRAADPNAIPPLVSNPPPLE